MSLMDSEAVVFELPPAIQPARQVRSVLLPREGIFWILAAVVMFITGLFKGIYLLVLLAYLLLGLWLVNLRLVERDLRLLRARRRAPEGIFVGRPAEFEIVASLNGSRPVRGLMLSEVGATHQRRWLILRLVGGQSVRLRYELSIERRGRYVVGPLQAQSQFPFGLVGRIIDLAPADDWIVLPRLGNLNLESLRRWLARATRGDGRTRVRRAASALVEADVHGLREFRAGDSPRWIHWRSTARRNQVLVREFEQNAPPALLLIIEPWLPLNPTAEDRDRLERLLSLASTVCLEWARDPMASISVIGLGDESVAFGPGNGWEYARRVLEWMAVQTGTPNVSAVADHAACFQRGAPTLVLTSRPESSLPELVADLSGRVPALVLAGCPMPWYECPFSRE